MYGVGAKGGINLNKQFSFYGKASVISNNDDVIGQIKKIADQKSINAIKNLEGLMYGVGIALEGRKNIGFFAEYLSNQTQTFLTGGVRINFRSRSKTRRNKVQNLNFLALKTVEFYI